MEGPTTTGANTNVRRVCPATLNPLPPESQVAACSCVFVCNEAAKAEAPQPSVPIPLWPQYKLTWLGQALPDYTWIRIGPTEHWMERMVDSMTKMPARNVAKKSCDKFRRGLSVPVWARTE